VIALALALTGIAAVCYVLVGYPLLLAALARRGAPVHKRPIRPTVSVILPVRNGAPWLEQKIRSILGQDYPAELVDILILSDGSNDATDEIALSFAGPRIRFERLSGGGKGAALSYAFPRVSGEILLLTDVRQELAPDCLRLLVECFADPVVGAVSGDLVIRRGATTGEESTGVYWRYESWIRRNLSQYDSLLGATGPIYALRSSLAVLIPPHTLLDDVYLPMESLRRGYRLIQEPAAKAYDFPTALDSEFRRKVRTQAGIYQLFRLSPWILTPANRLWFHWYSLKLGRLSLPFFLLLIALATPFTPVPWLWILSAGQLAFYGAAAVDTVASSRLTAPFRAFLILVGAALVSVSVFFVNPLSLWKETKVSSPAGK
jgi:cellulose synthase/poly-beta-1,6-N-acetylglucosamine synthase-like glycosyltransferase